MLFTEEQKTYMTSFCPFQKLFPVFKASAFSTSGIFLCADAGFGAEQIYECTHIEVYEIGPTPHRLAGWDGAISHIQVILPKREKTKIISKEKKKKRRIVI